MKYIVGNQKNYLKYDDVKDFVFKTNNLFSNNMVIICPSNIYLPMFDGVSYKVGTQDVSCSDVEPYTGEVTAKQLSSMNIKYSIVGHSERRTLSEENDASINRKINELLLYEITPILCIGENYEEKESNKTREVLIKEIDESLFGIESNRIIITYEPLWAISDGIHPNVIPSNSEIENIVHFIKDYIKNKYRYEPKVLYGGSVNPSNVESLNKIDIVDGYLIGGASKKPEDFIDIVNKCN